MPYQLLLKNGILVDPAQGIHALTDIAFAAGKVAAVGHDLAVRDSVEAVDCSGLIVTPGMIDLHAHVYWGVSHFGMECDPNCVAKGVTTAVDAGSAGADTFPGFRRYVADVSATRLFAMLNISSQGLLAGDIGELTNLRYASVSKAVSIIDQHRDTIVGVKVRLTKDSCVSEEAGIRPLLLAREAADATGLPMMVHPQTAWCDSIDDILSVMRNRDILTHCFHAKDCGILDPSGKIRDSVREALERGVTFDVGHGSASFSWDICQRALRQNFRPQTISTDLHVYSVRGPVYDLATTACKFLHLGLALDEVVRMVTAAPAQALGLSDKAGTLKVGAWGDAVVFDLQDGNFEFWDACGQVQIGRQRLVPTVIVRAGHVYRRGNDANHS